MKTPIAILIAFALLPAPGWTKDADLPDPAAPGSAVPPFKYQSTFRSYVPRRDDVEVSDWRGTRYIQQSSKERAKGQMQMQQVPAPRQTQTGGGGMPKSGMDRQHNMRGR